MTAVEFCNRNGARGRTHASLTHLSRLTCARAGLSYEVVEPKKMRTQKKSYGDNFRSTRWPSGCAILRLVSDSYRSPCRYWGRVVGHHEKTDPGKSHGIDDKIKDQSVLTNMDKTSGVNTSVL
jgi:hypothetical protein